MRFRRKLAVLVVASLAATALAVVGFGAAANADTPNGDLHPVSGSIGGIFTNFKCLDLRKQDGFNNPYARFQQWDCSGVNEQQFHSHPYYHLYGNTWLYQLVNLRSGMCMEVRDGLTTAGAQVDQFPCATSGVVDSVNSRQLWLETRFNGRSVYQMQPWSNTAMCLDVKGAENSNGVKIQQYTCNFSAAQQWYGVAMVDDGRVVA
jgi:pectate lyase